MMEAQELRWTTGPWVSGLCADAYYGPLRGFGASLEDALEDLMTLCREKAPKANWLIGLEPSVDLECGRWSILATAAHLIQTTRAGEARDATTAR